MQRRNGHLAVDKGKIAQMLRTEPLHVPAEWCLGPHFQFWPPQRHKAILWLLTHLAMYRMQQQRHQLLLDYIEFLRRTRWMSYRAASRIQQVGNYDTLERQEQTVVRMGHGVGRETPPPHRWNEAVKVWMLDDMVWETHYQNTRQKWRYVPMYMIESITNVSKKSPGWDEIFHPSRPSLLSTQPPVQWVPGLSRR